MQHNVKFELFKARNQSLMHHTHEQHRYNNSKWSVADLVDHFEAYLHMKNAEGVREVLLILNRWLVGDPIISW